MEAKLNAQAEQMARELAASASTIDELNGLLRGLMKSALERMPDAEMDVHLERQRQEPPLPFEPPAPNNLERWADICAMFDFPPAVRKAIYTTNAIESVNSVIRKFTRNREQYPSADSAVKLIWLAISEAAKKWTMPIVGWKQALNHFAVLFEDRMPAKLDN